MFANRYSFLFIAAILYGEADSVPWSTSTSIAEFEDLYKSDGCKAEHWRSFYESMRVLMMRRQAIKAQEYFSGLMQLKAAFLPDVVKGFECGTAAAALYMQMHWALKRMRVDYANTLTAVRVVQLATLYIAFDYRFSGGLWIDEPFNRQLAVPLETIPAGQDIRYLLEHRWKDFVGVLMDSIRAHRPFNTWPVRGTATQLQAQTKQRKSNIPTVGMVSICEYEANETPLGVFSKANKEAYCLKGRNCNLAFHEVSVRWAGSKRQFDERPLAWGKIDAVLIELLRGNQDWVAWFDCDSFVMNGEMSLVEGLIGPSAAKGDPTVMSVLRKMPEKCKNSESCLREALEPLVHKSDDPVDLVVSEDGMMINTGVFAMRTSARSILFLLDILALSMEPRIMLHPWWEQTAMALLLYDIWAVPRNKVPSTVFLQQDGMNGYPPGIKAGMTTHVGYREGDFAIAFNGCKIHLSHEVCNELFRQYYYSSSLHSAEHVGNLPGESTSISYDRIVLDQ